jgi:hypothetical protein
VRRGGIHKGDKLWGYGTERLGWQDVYPWEVGDAVCNCVPVIRRVETRRRK